METFVLRPNFHEGENETPFFKTAKFKNKTRNLLLRNEKIGPYIIIYYTPKVNSE